MRVKIAKNAGFCMGVKRAMDLVIDTARKAAKDEPVYTDGPLIHNPQVLEFLEQKGINVLDESTNPNGVRVVIRAHGIKPERKKKIENAGAKVCDATCPNVKSVQSIIKKYRDQGYSTIIIGDKGHAEVDGLLGYTEDNGYVVEGVQDVDSLPDIDKVCIVSQTTQSREVFDDVVARLKQRYKENKVFATICNSTSKRQENVINLTDEVDAMVVVGGRGSANTKRLAEISETKVPTFLVETEEELDMSKLKTFGTVGVTAGASTPNWMINRVVTKIQSYEQGSALNPVKYLKKAGRFLIGTSAYMGIGAGVISYSNSILLGIDPKLFFCVIAALFVFSLYTLNNLMNKEAVSFNEPRKASYYEKHPTLFLWLGISGSIFSIGFAFFVSLPVFFCLFFSSIFGVVYGLKIIPSRLSSIIKYRSLDQIPGSKELFAGIAWAVCTALIIFLGNKGGSPATLAVAFAFTLSITFIRAVFLDIRDIQGDKILGKETIPIAIGKKNTKYLLAIITICMAVLLAIAPLAGWTSNFTYYLLPCFVYSCLYLYLYHKRIIKGSLLCEAVADFNFILPGIMALVWRIN